MKRYKILTIFLSASLAASAQVRWLAHPCAGDSSQVWFRRTFVDRKVDKAWLNISTTGLMRVYVNGMNVTTAVFEPFRDDDGNALYGTQEHMATDAASVGNSHGSDAGLPGASQQASSLPEALPTSKTIDISGFIRPDTNVVAIWYSPARRQLNSRMVAAEFYGSRTDGTTFHHYSDGSWLCRLAPVTLNRNGSEDIDGRVEFSKWKNDDIETALWLPSVERGTCAIYIPTPAFTGESDMKVTHIKKPKSFNIQCDTTVYDFGNAFHGWIRVTLRKAKKGEVINIGGMRYVCNGKLDEQACQRFTMSSHRRVAIWGDDKFRREQIQLVEGIEINPVTTPAQHDDEE